MKITTRIIAVSAFALNLAVAAPIDDIGALSVQGTQVVGANGQPAQLRGMSFFWNIAKEAYPYYTADVVNWLAEDWHANLVRAAMAHDQGAWGDGDHDGYMKDPSKNISEVETIVDAAIAKGIYVIIDLHSHWMDDNSDGQRWNKAAEFFEYMATKYGKYPNVIYEIFNEPGTDEWSRVKPYAEFIIPKIRAIDPDNLIVVGTPGYSSKVDLVLNSPLTGDLTYNMAYTFHFYASEDWHLNNYLPTAKTVAKQIPLFVTECGLTPASGNGTINYNMVNTFWQWIDEEKLSWAAWSISNKDETSASLQKSASTSGNWTENDLRESGKWFRNKLREQNPEWTPITGGNGGGGDNPSKVSPRTTASPTGFHFANNTISANLKGQSKVELLNLQGRTVRTLWNGNANGNITLSVNANPGLYLVRIQGAGIHETHKVVVK